MKGREMSGVANPGDVMKRVREYWGEHVSGLGSADTGPDAPVVQAFRSAWSAVQSGSSPVDSAVSKAVQSTPQWKDAHRSAVEDIFMSITDRQPSEATLDEITKITDMDEVARRVVDLQAPSEDASSTRASANVCGGDVPPELSQPMVDETWIEEFADCYGRDPFVHEYVLVRPIGGDLGVLGKAHHKAFERLRTVHSQYLDENLTEQDFVKTYVPRVYHSQDVPDDVRRDALRRPQYRTAMESRLSSLHLVACGRELSQEEAKYLFEKDVLDKELPLDTDELNNVISAFVQRGEEVRVRVNKLMDLYLQRDADHDEVDVWVFPFRTQADAESSLRSTLISSNEFHAVLADNIRSHNVNIQTREVFRRLETALSQADLASIESRYDLEDVLEKAGVFGS
jgi:hypothetical protein